MKRQDQRLAERLAVFDQEAKLPKDLRDALDHHPHVRAQWEQHVRLSRLMTLKRYELSSSQAEHRVRESVRRHLQAMTQPEPEEDWASMWRGAFPILRFSLAALFVVLLAMHMGVTEPADTLPTIPRTAERLSTAPQGAAMQASASETMVRPNPDFAEMMLSNMNSRIMYSGNVQFIGLNR